MYDCKKYSEYTRYSKLFYEFFKGNDKAITYSEIARDVFNQDIDWFYGQLDKGLTFEQYDLIKNYMLSYKPRPLEVINIRASACYDLLAESIEQLKKDWKKNIEKRYKGKPQTINSSRLLFLTYNNLGFEYAGLNEKEIAQWLVNLEDETIAELQNEEQ